jgi:hypothetical protein
MQAHSCTRTGPHRGPGNPLEDIKALRNVQFVVMNGMVFKKDGAISSMDCSIRVQ